MAFFCRPGVSVLLYACSLLFMRYKVHHKWRRQKSDDEDGYGYELLHTVKQIEKKFLTKQIGANKSKVANHPKCVLPKFRADPSHVRRVHGPLVWIREA